jgi:hypothetical protein
MPPKISKNQRTDVAAQAQAERGSQHRWEKPDCPCCGALSRHRDKPGLGRTNRWRRCQNDHDFIFKDCAPARRKNTERKRGDVSAEPVRKKAGAA